MTAPDSGVQREEATRHDDRPLGVALSADLLRIGDKVNITIEAQMMGLPTSVFLTHKNVVYHGVTEHGQRRFDDELEPRFFWDYEIVRVALIEN